MLVSLADVVLGQANDESFKTVTDFYHLDKDNLKAEREIYDNLKIECELRTPTAIMKYLAQNLMCTILPHFSKAEKILATIPATSCSAERSSCLRRLKTYLRSTMGQERLTSLALLSIERHFANNLDLECIIDTFGRHHGRDKFFF